VSTRAAAETRRDEGLSPVAIATPRTAVVATSGFAIAAALVALGTMLGVAAPSLHAATFSADGELRYELFGYPDADRRGDALENFVEGRLRIRGELGASLAYRAEGRMVADDAEFTAGMFDPRMAEQRRPYLTIPEAVLDWRPADTLRLSLGRQIVNWSGVDELQPANLMAPLDESDVFRRVTMGAFGIGVHWGGPLTADLMVVPAAFQGNRLPQGRWRFVPDGIPLALDTPPVRMEETQVGLRIGAQLGALDAAVIGYVGRDAFPLFTLAPGAVSPLQGVVARYPRTRAAGFTASYPLGESILLRSEVVYHASPDAERDDFFQYVPLGIEYTRGDWRVVLHYLRYDRTHRGAGAVSQGERRFYPSFLFGEAGWDAGDRLRVRLRAGYDFQDAFVLVEPEVSYRVWRELRVGLVAHLVHDHASRGFDYFDLIRNEDRVGLRLQYFL
jgi:hypothetical protein